MRPPSRHVLVGVDPLRPAPPPPLIRRRRPPFENQPGVPRHSTSNVVTLPSAIIPYDTHEATTAGEATRDVLIPPHPDQSARLRGQIGRRRQASQHRERTGAHEHLHAA